MVEKYQKMSLRKNINILTTQEKFFGIFIFAFWKILFNFIF